MSNKHTQYSLPFGSPLGAALGDVVSYSSDYDYVDETQYPNRAAFRSYYDGIYMGYKWQCVEFARRWLYINKGLIFNDVTMAYEIFKLRTIRDLKNNIDLPLNAFKNGSKRQPELGSMLIWDEGGEFERTGHIAIITEVFDDKIRIAEQNMDFVKWPEGRNFSRELEAKIGDDGDYWIKCSFSDSSILGWVMQTENTQFSYKLPLIDNALFTIKSSLTKTITDLEKTWLNIANPDEAAYVKMMGGHYLSSKKDDFYRYYEVSQTATDTLESATDELHGMFMHATDYVIAHPELLAQFSLPASIHEKVIRSWGNRRNELITSRFDFAMTKNGPKVYEYNCDSASCYMEAAKIQGKWAKHVQLRKGDDNGRELFQKLVTAWKNSDASKVVHVLQDQDAEEDYHALFMQSAIEAAGLKSIRVIGLSSLSIDALGNILDEFGNIVTYVWKTWAWETALEDLREDKQSILLHNSLSQPSLAQVLLNDSIMVYEPLWTLIPSNKAILPILWSLFPRHPLLLCTEFTLTEQLKSSGYVIKPIVGRCGENIRLMTSDNEEIESTKGSFAQRDNIYQALCPLPLIEDYFVQICTFTVAGEYAGSNVRVDSSMIIGKDSDCMALRTIDDDTFQP